MIRNEDIILKKILFVIDNLNLGGVEKSLISLLNYIDTKEYEIDILPLVSKGILENEITKKNITVLQVPYSKFDTRLLSDSFKETVSSNHSIPSLSLNHKATINNLLVFFN